MLRSGQILLEWIGLAPMVVLVVTCSSGCGAAASCRPRFGWYDEVARLCFVWIIFLAAAVAVGRRLHFRMHLVVDRLGPQARAAIARLISFRHRIRRASWWRVASAWRRSPTAR